MSVTGQLRIDGPVQLQVADNACGREIKDRFYCRLDAAVGDHAGAKSIHRQTDRFAPSDGVGDLHLASLRHARRHDVLRDPAGGICAGAVYLRRVFARKRAAADVRHGAILIYRQLSPGQARVRSRTAQNEFSRRIDEDAGILLQQFSEKHLAQHFLANETSDVLMVDFRVMLQRNNHGGHGDGHVILIGNSDLRLTVRAQPRGGGLQFVQPSADAMCQHHGQGQVFFRFVGGIAHHNTLIACAECFACTEFGFPYGGGDVRRLFVETDLQFQQVMGIFAEIAHGVADAVDYIRHDPSAVYFRLGSNLAANDDLVRRSEDFHGDAGIGILPEMRVQNGVRHLIAELVGMTGADRFRRNQSGVFLVHDDSPCQS